MTGDAAIGMMAGPADHTSITGDPMALLVLLVAVLIAAARYIIHRRREASIDPLTGCLTRRAGKTALWRLRYPVNILLVDIDNMGAFNRVHGPEAGDWLLWRTGQILLNAAPVRDDFVVRWRDDKFLVVLADGLAFPEAHCDRVRAALASAGIAAAVGAAIWDPAEEPLSVAVDMAEAAMHAAKRQQPLTVTVREKVMS